MSEAATVPDVDGIYSGIDEGVYHSDPTSLSSTGARKLLPPSCPAIYRYERDNPPPPRDVCDFGHVAHELALAVGAGYVPLDPAMHGLTKDGKPADKPTATVTWKAAASDARAAGKIPIHVDDLRRAQAMADAVRQHPIAGALFEDGAPELSGYYTDPDTGIRLRYRTDWLTTLADGRPLAVDYQTVAGAHPGHCSKAVADYGYHQQAAFYIDGLAANDVPDAAFLFVVQSKTPPYLVIAAELDAAAITLGRRRNYAAIDLYAKCVAEDYWPGYGDGIHTISLPAWAAYQQ